MPRFKDQAICIRHIDWSETSQVVALLTWEHGKVRALAKGSKRTSPGAVARFSGGIELLTQGQAVGVIKPSTDLASLTEWDLQNPYFHLRRDLAAHQTALYGADLSNTLLADHDPHAGVFAALAELLEALVEPSRRVSALAYFQWRLLDDCGYRPQIDADAGTGLPLEDCPTYVFDPRAGGITTAPGRIATGHNGSGPWRVRRETVEVLRALDRGDLVAHDGREEGSGSGHGSGADPGVVARANRLLCVYARAIIDRTLPTMKFVLEDR